MKRTGAVRLFDDKRRRITVIIMMLFSTTTGDGAPIHPLLPPRDTHSPIFIHLYDILMFPPPLYVSPLRASLASRPCFAQRVCRYDIFLFFQTTYTPRRTDKTNGGGVRGARGQRSRSDKIKKKTGSYF